VISLITKLPADVLPNNIKNMNIAENMNNIILDLNRGLFIR
jgi:hypothetical protein